MNERILQFIDFKQLKKSSFYKITGLSNGFLDKKGNIGSDKIEIILNCYPEINPAWLLTGRGEMLLTGDNIPSSNSVVAQASAVLDAKLVVALTEQNETNKDYIKFLKENNLHLKELLAICEDKNKSLAPDRKLDV